MTKNTLWKPGIRMSLTLPFIGILTITSIVLGVSSVTTLRSSLEESLDRRADVLAKTLAAALKDPVAMGEVDRIEATFAETMQADSDLLYLIVIDTDARVIMSTNSALLDTVLKRTEFETRMAGVDKTTWSELPEDPSNFEIATVVAMDDDRLGVLRVGVSRASVHALIRTSSWTTAIVSLLSLAIGIAIYDRTTRKITDPIAETVSVLEAVAEGNLDRRLDFEGTDELVRMSRALNTAIENMRSALDDVRSGAARQERDSEALNEAAEKVLAFVSKASTGDLTVEVESLGEGAIAEIATSLGGFLSDLRERIRKMGETSDEMSSASDALGVLSQTLESAAGNSLRQADSLTATTQEMNSDVQTVASATEELSATLSDISENTKRGAEAATDAVALVGSTNQTVEKLGRSSEEIGKVIQVINDIAAQTNLLALNATIEAASAGEAGRGFAVVANEVKELAKGTGQATSEISKVIETLQADSRDAASSIGEITSAIEELQGLSEGIAKTVEEQRNATNEIARSVASAASGSNSILTAVQEVSRSASDTNTAADATGASAKHLSAMSNELNELVSRFEVGA